MPVIDPTTPNIPVQQISNPGRRGVTTGRVRRVGTRVYVEVEIGPNNRIYIEHDDVEIVQAVMASPGELITTLRFGSHGDLARILVMAQIGEGAIIIYLQKVGQSQEGESLEGVYNERITALVGADRLTKSVSLRLNRVDDLGLFSTFQPPRSPITRLQHETFWKLRLRVIRFLLTSSRRLDRPGLFEPAIDRRKRRKFAEQPTTLQLSADRASAGQSDRGALESFTQTQHKTDRLLRIFVRRRMGSFQETIQGLPSLLEKALLPLVNPPARASI